MALMKDLVHDPRWSVIELSTTQMVAAPAWRQRRTVAPATTSGFVVAPTEGGVPGSRHSA